MNLPVEMDNVRAAIGYSFCVAHHLGMLFPLRSIISLCVFSVGNFLVWRMASSRRRPCCVT